MWSFAIAAGERFFCSRIGVKDWAKTIEPAKAARESASGSFLNCMGARVANSDGFEKSMDQEFESLGTDCTDGTDSGTDKGNCNLTEKEGADIG